jgi:hypothetical protein
VAEGVGVEERVGPWGGRMDGTASVRQTRSGLAAAMRRWISRPRGELGVAHWVFQRRRVRGGVIGEIRYRRSLSARYCGKAVEN